MPKVVERMKLFLILKNKAIILCMFPQVWQSLLVVIANIYYIDPTLLIFVVSNFIQNDIEYYNEFNVIPDISGDA